MSDMKMYDILGHFNNLDTKLTPVTDDTINAPVYENVEPRGDIMQAVKSLETKYQTFKEAKAKPDFLDVDKDGDKAELDEGTLDSGDFDSDAFYDGDLSDQQFLAKHGFTKQELYDHPVFAANNEYEREHDRAVRHEISPEGQLADAIKRFKPGPYSVYSPERAKHLAQNWWQSNSADYPNLTKEQFFAQIGITDAIAENYDDEDGDKAEPFKKAVKDKKAKELDESVADDIADAKAAKEEENWWDKKSDTKTSRTIKGSKYGGSKQKDDDDDFKSKKTAILDKDDEEDLDEGIVDAIGSRIGHAVKGAKRALAGKSSAKQVQQQHAVKARAGQVNLGSTAQQIAAAPGEEKKAERTGKVLRNVAAQQAGYKNDIDEAFEFGSKNFKNASNLKKAPKAKLVKESAVRNHPIYTNPEAWDHYKKELDEEELNKATQELDEIAKLAGLPKQINVDMNKGMGAPAKADGVTLPPAPIEQEPMLETVGVTLNGKEINVGSIEVENVDPQDRPDFADAYVTYAEFTDGTPLSDEELIQLEDEHGDLVNQAAHDSTINEASTRKDFRMVADLLKNIPDDAKRKELAQHHADIFKQQNPRFSHDKFYAAAGVVNEDEMEEGNEFSGALAAAKATGAKDFEVAGKKYTVKEDININVTASGEEDAVNLIRKLSGMPIIAIAHQHEEEPCDVCGTSPCSCEQVDEEYSNTPHEQTAPVSAVTSDAGGGLNGPKKQYPLNANKGANPMESVKEAALWQAYESMLDEVKE